MCMLGPCQGLLQGVMWDVLTWIVPMQGFARLSVDAKGLQHKVIAWHDSCKSHTAADEEGAAPS